MVKKLRDSTVNLVVLLVMIYLFITHINCKLPFLNRGAAAVPPACTLINCGSLPCCGTNPPACYSPSVYVCTSSGNLCPVSAPERCGDACYSPSVYNCVNNQLQPKTNPGTPPPSSNPPPGVSCNKLGPWMPGKSAAVVHSEGASAVLGNKLYIFSGFQGTELNCGNRLDIYDITTDSWTQGSNFPISIGISHMQAAAWTKPPNGVARSIFMAGGFPGPNGGPAVNQVWRYDVFDNRYYDMPPLPEKRASGAVVIDSNHKLHYIGGLYTDRVTNSDIHWTLNLLDPGANWVNSGDKLPMARNHVQGIQLGNSISLAGGQLGHEPNYAAVHTPYVHAYDINSKVWTRLADEPTPRSHSEASTLVINGKLVQFGGRSLNWDNLATVVEYDPARNAWSSLPSLPAGRLSPSAGFFRDVVVKGVRGDYVVITCGMNNPAPTDTWISRVTTICS